MRIIKLKNSGFTLVEMLVATAIFGIIAVIAGSMFIQILGLQRRANNTQQVEENSAFILDTISKELRVSVLGIVEDTDCSNAPLQELSFTNQNGDTVRYYTDIVDGVSYAMRDVNAIPTILSSNTVSVSRFVFCVFGAQSGDLLQPRVTVLTKIESLAVREQASLEAQVTVSPRFLSE